MLRGGVVVSRKKHRVTIYDIARQVGVSASTVSRCFHSPTLVNDETRQLVLREAERLGYRPNNVARSLIRGRSDVIGVIVPDIENPSFAAIIGSLEEAAAAHGYALFLGNSHEDLARERKLVELFSSYQVGGMILIAPRAPSLELQAWVTKNIPFVLVNRMAPWDACDWVSVDHRRAAELAVEHLVTRGRRSILYLAGPAKSEANAHREQGAIATAAKYGVKLHVVDTEGLPVALTAHHLMQQLDRLPSFDAVLAYNDLMALGCMQALLGLQIRVPQDVSVLGFDNLSWGQFTTPSLTSVAQPLDALGCEAFTLLSTRLSAKEVPVQKRRLEPFLVERDSTKVIASPQASRT
jgi:DNA-binding LacI/PurR family transcriptional regulator